MMKNLDITFVNCTAITKSLQNVVSSRYNVGKLVLLNVPWHGSCVTATCPVLMGDYMGTQQECLGTHLTLLFWYHTFVTKKKNLKCKKNIFLILFSFWNMKLYGVATLVRDSRNVNLTPLSNPPLCSLFTSQ